MKIFVFYSKKKNIYMYTLSRQHRNISISSVAQLCLILCDPTACITPDLPVHHQIPELAQTHVHRVGDVPFSSCLQSFPASESYR